MTGPRPGSGRTGPASIRLIVADQTWRGESQVLPLIRRAARLAARAPRAGGGTGPRRPEINVLLTADEVLRDLNAKFRRRAKPTNVLSFPAAPVSEPCIGDIALAYGVLSREAAAQGKTMAAHAAHLTVHGVLHLLGYDHETRRDAGVMEGLEVAILSQMGIGNPYEAVPVRRGPKRPGLMP